MMLVANKQRRGCEKSQRVQSTSALVKCQTSTRVFGVAEQVLLAQHCPLGPARCAGGVEERRPDPLSVRVYGVECVGSVAARSRSVPRPVASMVFNSRASDSGNGAQCA